MSGIPNFTIDVETPFKRAVEGFNTARANRLKAEKEAAIQRQQQVLQQDLLGLAEKENPTAQDFTRVMIKHPKMSENIQRAYGLMSLDQQKVRLNDASELYSSLVGGNTDVAKKLLEDRIEAANNSNLPGEARKFEALSKLIDKDPNAAKLSMGVTLSAIMGPEKFANTFQTLTAQPKEQETFRPLTDAEAKRYGLDPKNSYQLSSKGKISQIGKAGVSVNINQGKVGQIPKGYALKTGPDGELFMEPIKGGPIDKELKEAAEKSKKQGELKARATNVVIEDIERLKDTIEKAPWYSPVTGSVSQFIIPGLRQNRVNAEALKSTIVANIGFDRLQQMRDASKSGGALGNISDQELKTLQAVMGSLEFDQGEKQLLKNLERLNKVYAGILKKANVYDNAEEFGFGGGQKVEAESPAVQQVDQNIESILELYRDK